MFQSDSNSFIHWSIHKQNATSETEDPAGSDDFCWGSKHVSRSSKMYPNDPSHKSTQIPNCKPFPSRMCDIYTSLFRKAGSFETLEVFRCMPRIARQQSANWRMAPDHRSQVGRELSHMLWVFSNFKTAWNSMCTCFWKPSSHIQPDSSLTLQWLNIFQDSNPGLEEIGLLVNLIDIAVEY